MRRRTRLLALAVSVALVLAACGGDDDAADTTAVATGDTEATTAAPATTTVPPAATTTAAETTTTPAPDQTTTTAQPETTTTSSPPVVAGDAAEVVAAKTAAVVAVAPADWTTVVDNELGDAGADDIYGACSGPGSFDLANLDASTVAISTLAADAPQDPTTFFPGPSASIEARVFESAAVAADAFSVLETVIGTTEGRDCLADQLLGAVGDAPEDAEYDIAVEPATVSGADVGATLIITATTQGLTLEFQFDLVATLQDDCTIYGTFVSFGGAFDPAVRDQLYGAAIST